jgi:hypothetical protein
MKKIVVLVLIVLVAILSVPVFYTKQLSNVLQKQKHKGFYLLKLVQVLFQ